MALLQAIQEIETHLVGMRFTLQELYLAMQQAMHGVISPWLISPSELLGALREVQKQLPPPLQLVIPATVLTVSQYYKLATISLTQTENLLCIHLIVPVMRLQDMYHSFTVHTVPMKWEGMNKFVRYDTKGVLLLAKTGNASVTLTEAEWQKCRRTSLKICPSETVFDQVPTCELQLFMGKNNTRVCHRRISRS